VLKRMRSEYASADIIVSEGWSSNGEEDIVVEAKVRRIIDNGSTERGDGFGIVGDGERLTGMLKGTAPMGDEAGVWIWSIIGADERVEEPCISRLVRKSVLSARHCS